MGEWAEKIGAYKTNMKNYALSLDSKHFPIIPEMFKETSLFREIV